MAKSNLSEVADPSLASGTPSRVLFDAIPRTQNRARRPNLPDRQSAHYLADSVNIAFRY